MHIRSSIHLLLGLIVCALSDDDDDHQTSKGITLPGFIDSDDIRLTVYMSSWLSQTAAADVCRRQHTGGRLVTILHEETQWKLNRALNSSSLSLVNWYWTGARLMWLDRWTWLDNRPYYEHEGLAWLQFSDTEMHKRGYASIRIISDKNCRISVQPIIDQPRPWSQALCQCHGCTDHDYFQEPATRWHEGRNICRRISDTSDLAVLSDRNSTPSVIRNSTLYFIGLSNIRLIWNLPGRNVEATYTNWNDLSPADKGNDSCVYASRSYNWKWQTAKCDEKKPFICEHAVTPPPPPSSSSSATFTLVALLGAVLLAVVIVIIFCCRLNKSKRNRNVDGTTQPTDDQQYAEIGHVASDTYQELQLSRMTREADIDAVYTRLNLNNPVDINPDYANVAVE